MNIADKLSALKKTLNEAELIAVSKTHPVELIREAYDAGQRHFGENKVQELIAKEAQLPSDIKWHLIGHLQTNKVKYIAPFVHLIHSVDSLKLLKEINKRGKQNERIINCLLQVFIAQEETKFGLDHEEVKALLDSEEFKSMTNVNVIGLMGMATNTDDETQVEDEFKGLKSFFDDLRAHFPSTNNWNPSEVSMGMSSDYELAVKAGSTMVRIGSSIFGNRKYL